MNDIIFTSLNQSYNKLIKLLFGTLKVNTTMKVNEDKMNNITEIAQKNNLTLIEVGILIELDKQYPKAVFFEEEKINEQVQNSFKKLLDKGLIEKKWNKYRIIK